MTFSGTMIIMRQRHSKRLLSISRIFSMQNMYQWTSMQSYRHADISLKTKKHQLHAIVKHAHQMLRNLIRSVELQDNPYLDSDDPWLGILAAAYFAMCSMYHTTLHMTPGQLIFGRDMILNMQYLADWTVFKAHKQQLICKNNIIKIQSASHTSIRWEIR